MQLNVLFDLNQQVYAIVPAVGTPNHILAGIIARIDVTAQINQSQVESYYVDDGTQQHIIPGRRIFITAQAAQDILDIIA